MEMGAAIIIMALLFYTLDTLHDVFHVNRGTIMLLLLGIFLLTLI